MMISIDRLYGVRVRLIDLHIDGHITHEEFDRGYGYITRLIECLESPACDIFSYIP